MRTRDLFFVVLMVFIDQGSKGWFSTKVVNEAGAFGLGEGFEFKTLMIFALLILVGVYLKSEKMVERMGLVLIISSGFSNLIDRVFLGGVRDFIFWPYLNVYGNVADVLLVVGVGLILFDLVANKQN